MKCVEMQLMFDKIGHTNAAIYNVIAVRQTGLRPPKVGSFGFGQSNVALAHLYTHEIHAVII
jgi:hypothetical protein